MPRSAIQAAVVFLTVVLLGCDNQPLTFTGTWRGANSQFSDVTLALTQNGAASFRRLLGNVHSYSKCNTTHDRNGDLAIP